MKRYAIEYAKIREYEVIKETDQTITVTNRYSFDSTERPRRMSKAGTYPTARQAIEAHVSNVVNEIERLHTALGLKKQCLKTYREILQRPDGELFEAFRRA